MDELKYKQSIRRSREECNLTQKELAEKIGISTNAYAEIESGKTRLFNEHLPLIAQETKRSLETLVMGFNPQHEIETRLGEAEAEFNKKVAELDDKYKLESAAQNAHIASLIKVIDDLKKELDNKNAIIAKLLEK